MKALGLGLGSAVLAVLGFGCGGRAAGELAFTCVSSVECDPGSECRSGTCVPRLSRLPTTEAPEVPTVPLEPPQGTGTECTERGCVGGPAPPISGGGGAAGAAASPGSIGAAGTGAGGTGAAGAGEEPPEPTLDLGGLRLTRRLPGATAMVADPLRERVYVAMGSTAPKFPNSIVLLDPSTTQMIMQTSVGPNPTSLTLSDDGSTLWVGLHDSSSVRKVDVSGEAALPGAEYVLPSGDYAPYPHAAGPMVVLPGTTSSLAVTLHIDNLSPSLVGVVLLDEGEPRPQRLPSGAGASRLTRGPGSFLLGFNDMDGAFGVYSIAVSPEGLSQTEHRNLISGFETDITYDSNLLFATDGSIVDVSNPELPLAAGRLPVAGPVLPRVTAGLAWVLVGAQSHAYPAPLSLALIELQTLGIVSSTELGTEILLPRGLIRSANGVLAFIADAPEQTTTGFEFTSGVYLLQQTGELEP